MAKKSYLIRQERKFNGDVTVASLTYECDETEIQSILDKMEGVLTVFTEDTALSSVDGASNVVTSGLVIDNVQMVHSEAKTRYFGAYNKPIIFKSSVSVTELQNMFEQHKPFNGAYAEEKPDAAYPKIGNLGQL